MGELKEKLPSYSREPRSAWDVAEASLGKFSAAWVFPISLRDADADVEEALVESELN